MTGYFGYFMQGMQGGIQTGMQLLDMKWKKDEKKRLEKKQEEMLAQASTYNKMVAGFYDDKIITDDEMMQANASWTALAYEVKGMVEGSYKAIEAMDKKTVEQNNQWFDMLPDIYEGDPKDVAGMSDRIRANVKGEVALLRFDALDEIMRKKNEAAQNVSQTEVFTSPEAVKAKYPDSGYTYSASAGGYVPTYQKPTKEEAPPTEMDIMGETQKKLDAAYETGNANYFNQMAKSLNVPTTFETYKQKYEKPEGAGGVTPEKFRATSLSTQNQYIEKALNADKWEDAEDIIKEYEDAGYDPARLKEKVTKEAWANVKKSDLDNLVAVLNEITAGTPEGRNIKGKKKFAFEMDGESTEKTGEEWYKQVYESYVALLKLLEEQGIDTRQYKKLKPLSEIKKIKFGGFVGGGVETGDLTFIYY